MGCDMGGRSLLDRNGILDIIQRMLNYITRDRM